MEVLIPRVLALITQRGARVRLRLQQQVAHPYRSLERGEADFLIIPGIFCSPDHPQQKLFADHFVSVVWQHSPLAEGELTLERYLAASHVDMQPTEAELPVLEHWFTAEHRQRRHIAVTSHNFVAIPHMVVGTHLIGTVHSRLAQRMLPAIPVVVRPVPLAMTDFEQTLQWHKYRSRDPGLIWLRDLLAEAATMVDTPIVP